MNSRERTSTPSRVVLVGRTGFEHALRRDAGVELARARTPLEAIGEFVEISEPHDKRPATVIVGPETLAPSIAAPFVDALRKLDANVRVVAMGEMNGAAGVFDAVIPGALIGNVDTLHHALGGPPPTPIRSAPRDTTPPARPSTESAPVRPAPAHSAPTPALDAPSALAAMLAGRDPVAAAIEELSHRLGAACSFKPGEAPPDGEPAARISHSGRTLGWLLAPGLPRAAAESEAATLAVWILLAAQHDQLRRAAFTDELTGAFNRRYFNRFLAAAMEQARAKRHTVTLLVFDIDNFKTYNDRYSHAAGDEILIEAVRLLTSVIRPTDRVCRVGGDEFAVIFHDPEGPRNPGAAAPPQTIAQIADRFQKQICAHRFPKLLDEAPGTLTISGGLATFPWDGATPEELLARADELAMKSKRQGKNFITFGPGAERACRIGDEGPTADR